MPSRVLTMEERTFIVESYFTTNSITATKRKFQNKFRSKAPCTKAIKAIIKKFREVGSVHDRKRTGRPRCVRSEENIATLRAAIDECPTSSIRKLSSDTKVGSYSSVRSILKLDLKLHPYKPTILNALKDTDHENRVAFCTEWLDRLNRSPNLLQRILFSDECYFSLDRSVLSKNIRIWADSNPHAYLEHQMHPKRVLVWCAFSSAGVIGPFYFDAAISSESYLQMLQRNLVPALRRRGLLGNVIFQQDGAGPHTGSIVMNWLARRFGNDVISRLSDNPWPSRSPDLSPLDYFLWGYLKETMKLKPLDNVEMLKNHIKDGIRQVNADAQLRVRVLASFRTRLHRCIEQGGRHIETCL